MKNNYRSPWHSLILGLFFIVVAFSGGFYLGQGDTQAKSLAQNKQEITVTRDEVFNFNVYWELWDALKENYFDKTKLVNRDIFYSSLKGLAASTKDPYTIFMTPEETEEFAEDMSGIFEGIGAEVGMRDDLITIIAPLSGTPAEKAGLRAGDRVYAIDGQSALGLSINEAVKKIRGPKGTKVTLTVISEGEVKTKEITIERGLIIIESVELEFRNDGIAIITVSNFNDDTEFLFKKAVADIVNKKSKGVVLDLRNNPGGYLDTSILMASEWVESGPILLEQGPSGRRREYNAEGLARLSNLPTVVLINGGSASASEIVAGALRDYGKAILVGEETFGKGSVQKIIDLSDGSSLKVTVATWMTPDGDYINDKGLEPDEVVILTNEDYEAKRDPQLDRALEILKKK